MNEGSEQLTLDELQALINIVAQTNVPIGQSQPFIDLINKMSRMIDQQRAKITSDNERVKA